MLLSVLVNDGEARLFALDEGALKSTGAAGASLERRVPRVEIVLSSNGMCDV